MEEVENTRLHRRLSFRQLLATSLFLTSDQRNPPYNLAVRNTFVCMLGERLFTEVMFLSQSKKVWISTKQSLTNGKIHVIVKLSP